MNSHELLQNCNFLVIVDFGHLEYCYSTEILVPTAVNGDYVLYTLFYQSAFYNHVDYIVDIAMNVLDSGVNS